MVLTTTRLSEWANNGTKCGMTWESTTTCVCVCVCVCVCNKTGAYIYRYTKHVQGYWFTHTPTFISYPAILVCEPLIKCLHFVHSMQEPLELMYQHPSRELLSKWFELWVIGASYGHSWSGEWLSVSTWGYCVGIMDHCTHSLLHSLLLCTPDCTRL